MKLLFERVVALVILCIFLPMILLLSIIVWVDLGFPIFFSQLRAGHNNKLFKMVKFRTMNNIVNKDGEVLPDESRLSSIGILLRKLSLDELPSLWCVVKGDMSIVGPRPLLPKYLPLYSVKQARRHEVKPGITGWAQINGRNAISWEEKFDLDVWYVDNKSLWLDIKILWLTLKKVISQEGISAKGKVTMPEFKRYKKDD